MQPKENPERACEECIHFFACSRQCGEPMAQSSATGCECYETVKSSMAYYVGTLDGVKGKIPNRLREIAEADKDGRCVVLPCKVGDTVWRIVRDGEPHITRDEVRDMYFADDMTLCVELVGGRVTFTEKFGKTVFLSRAEAERALQEMEGKKDGNETSM